ncbi:Retrovirus-related Pol polyprotein from transposon TNT 1-94 [Gossypium australe]|uniref:Retrovirus-related Pol polyprotein from transposon TNT 1-94 n=1 Tax=Gossypium australe TaxID=47621 RepID=A0A5B6UYN9_9ROSI|nr:Retrovirus-related Pol polyprotein from transposon TNT 1-94 [Gossypium australe]
MLTVREEATKPFGFKPSVSHLKIFGCVCYALILAVKRNKLERRAQPGIFVGYSSCRKGYRIFDPFTNKVFESRNVKFSEEALWIWEAREAELVEQTDEVQNQHVDFFDDLPVRGTRAIFDVYERCNVTVLEPISYEEEKKCLDKSYGS